MLGKGSEEAHAKYAESLNAELVHTSNGIQAPGISDQWYIDDGQIFSMPFQTDPYLKELDKTLKVRGAQRATGAERTSVSRLWGPVEAHRNFDGWCTPYVANSCKTPDSQAPPSVLGAPVGPFGDISGAIREITRKINDLHGRIQDIQDSATELTLTRKCADVSRAMYLLRCCGDRISDDIADEFDEALRRGTGSSLRCDLTDDAWDQATLGVTLSGLGMRTMRNTRLPAVVASMLASAPKVNKMCADLVRAGLAKEGVLEALFHQRIDSAVV